MVEANPMSVSERRELWATRLFSAALLESKQVAMEVVLAS